MCLCLKAIIKVNQPSSSSSTAGGAAAAVAAAGAGAVAVAVVIFFCPTGMLLGAVKDRKRINVCQIRTYVHVHVFTVTKRFRELGNKLNLSTIFNSELNRTTGLTLLTDSKQLIWYSFYVWWPDASSLEPCLYVCWSHGPVPSNVKHRKEFSLCYCSPTNSSVKSLHLEVKLILKGTEWILVQGL